MAIITKSTQPTNPLTGSLSGQVQIDEGRGTITFSENGVRTFYMDKDGLHMDIAGEYRLLLGKRPDNELDLLITKPGNPIPGIF